MAVLKTWERRDSSRKEYMAVNPAVSWSIMNSDWYFTAAAEMSTMATCVMNAVRESINIRMNIGTMHNGIIYTLKRGCFIRNDTISGNIIISAERMVTLRGLLR